VKYGSVTATDILLGMVRRTERAGMPDLIGMQALVQRIWSPASRWHIGDVAWNATSVDGAADAWRTAVWTDGGETVAWGWAETNGGAHLDLVVDPSWPELAHEVLDWFDALAAGGTTTGTCTVLEPEEHLVAALAAHGYTVDSEAPWFSHHHRLLADLEPLVPPDGFRLRPVRPGETAARSAVHRAAWSDLGPSRVTAQSYAEVMDTWPYRFELDWVAETEDGELVASALGWLDERAKVGLLEPVGSAPRVRRRGLGRAVSLAVLHALRDAGATAAVVCPRGDAAYPVPGQLYRGLGFRPAARTLTYQAPNNDVPA
jgi:predicted N-acetyltransferase YhbS